MAIVASTGGVSDCADVETDVACLWRLYCGLDRWARSANESNHTASFSRMTFFREIIKGVGVDIGQTALRLADKRFLRDHATAVDPAITAKNWRKIGCAGDEH